MFPYGLQLPTVALVCERFSRDLVLRPRAVGVAEVSLLRGVVGSSELADHLLSPLLPGAGIELVKLVLSPDPPLSPHGTAAAGEVTESQSVWGC